MNLTKNYLSFIVMGLGIITITVCPVFGGVFDCLWGGVNEETSYTPSYFSGMGGVTLSQSPPPQPPINFGAPPPTQQAVSPATNQIIPVQPTPQTQATSVPQATIPTITVPVGPVGSVGNPATQPVAANVSPLPPGAEIVYVMPNTPAQEECLDGVRGIPATAANVVPPGTPGAIPVAVKTVTVLKPKIEYRWTFSPMRTQTETLVKVVHPKTGKVLRTYCQTEEETSVLPCLHRKEIVSYETVTAKVGTPVSLAPSAITTTNTVIQTPTTSTPAATRWQSQYGHLSPDHPTDQFFDHSAVERSSYSTVIVP